MALSIIKEMNIPTDRMIICLNTKTIYDIFLGSIRENLDGINILNGGIPPLFAISGRNGNFKSNILYSLLSSMLDIYPESEGIIYDSENNLTDTRRICDIAGKDISNRVGIFQSTDYDLESVSERIKEIGEFKLKHIKDFTVETPFYNADEKKNVTMLIPTYCIIDSFTIAKSPMERELLETTTLCDSKTNMLFMQDGMAKTKFMNNAIDWTNKYGIYFLFSSQIGDKKDLNPMQPTPKQSQWMTRNDKLKSVGARFEFLVNTLIQNKVSNSILDSDKECYYPIDGSCTNDVNEITSLVVRCKSSEGGSLVPIVCSQRNGLLKDITNLHYLKENKFGLKGKQSWTNVLCPNKTFTRKNIREKCKEDYELSRSIEILTHYFYIKENWPHHRFKTINLKLNDEEFAEKLINNKSYLISDILNSRGYWTYNKKESRPYLSIIDILKLIQK